MSRTVKAVFFDSENEKVEDITIEANLFAYYEKLNCRLIEKVAEYDNGDWLVVDEEGFLTPAEKFTVIEVWRTEAQEEVRFIMLIAKSALLLGANDYGETRSAQLQAKDFIGKVKFLNYDQMIYLCGYLEELDLDMPRNWQDIENALKDYE